MKHEYFAVRLNNRLLLFLFATILPFVSQAQTQRKITLAEAINMGITASNQLKISQGKLDYAQAKHDETFDLQYPSAKLTAGYSRLSDVPEFQVLFPGATEPQTLFPVYLNSYQNRISINEVIFAGFRVKTAKEAANKTLGAAQYDLKKDRNDVGLNIITAYFNLYKVQQAVGIIDQNLELINQRLKDVQNFENNGMATHNDELRVELQQSNTQLVRIDAETILKVANYNFNLLIGLPGDVDIVLDTTAIFTMRNVNAQDAFITNALQNRPEMQSLLLKNQAAQDNLKIAQNGFWPTLSAGANFFYASPNIRYIPPTNEFKATWDLGLTLNWDITNVFTNKHVIAENQALLDQADAARQQLSDGIKSEVYQNYLAYSQSLEKLEVLNKTVTIAEENLSVTNSRYHNNVAVISDVTDAQTQQIQSQINYVIAEADAQIAYYKLLVSSGNWDPQPRDNK
ncbi:MAG TPA: TolC family protein [Chitinophagales bacterium]|nr:TolC family protein [Chitinophagales bacterium]